MASLASPAPVSAIPAAPGGWPLLGHLVPFARDPVAFIGGLSGRHGLVRIRFGPYSAVAVCDHKLTQQAIRDADTYEKGGPLFDRMRELTGNGLAAAPISQHRRQRALMQPSFHRNRLPGYGEIFLKEITATTSAWRDGQILDVPAEMMEFELQATVASLFSQQLPQQLRRRLVEDLRTFEEEFLARALTPPLFDRFWPTPGCRRFYQARARLRRMVGDVVTQRKTSSEDHDDLLSPLLTAPSDPDVAPEGFAAFSDSELVDQVLTFALAAVGTSATTLSWALCMLAYHPDAQEALHAEIERVLQGAAVTYADLPRLEYTRCFIAETTRLYPAGWIFTRQVERDTTLGDYRIPAGTVVFLSPYLVHHTPGLYEGPEDFAPQRWRDSTAPMPHGAYLPFGAGPRKCIGDQLGLVSLALVLATIAARWRVEPLPDAPQPPEPNPVLRPAGLRLRIRQR
ncbi:cytochrome P450 [Streptomyces sp. NPDC050698]